MFLETMKTKFVLFIFAFLCFIYSTSAQDFIFKVLINKGSNLIQSEGEWKSIKPGDLLFRKDSVKVEEDSYIGLFHHTGGSLELTKPGIYKVSDLALDVGYVKEGVVEDFVEFVMNKMLKAEDSDLKPSVSNEIERLPDITSLKVILPSTVDMYNSVALIRWIGFEGINNYTVTIKDIFDEVINEFNTEESLFRLNLNSRSYRNEKLVVFSVRLADDEVVQSVGYGIKRLVGKERTKITESYNALISELGDDSALDKLVFAAFFEDNNLILDALTNHERAMYMFPEVEEFRIAYDQFVIRNGLNN
jgi:hypothetical protein